LLNLNVRDFVALNPHLCISHGKVQQSAVFLNLQPL